MTRDNAIGDVPMDAGIRPFHCTFDIPMLDRIVVDVIHMSTIIPLIANHMLQ